MSGIPWRSVKDDGFPAKGQRVMAVQASPIIGTEIVTLYGRDFDGSGYHTEPFITHWCPTSDIAIPPGTPAIAKHKEARNG